MAGIDTGSEEDEPIATKFNISHYFIVQREEKGKEKFKYLLKTNCIANIRMGRKIISEQTVHLSKELLERETLKKESVDAQLKIITRIMEKMEAGIRKELEFVHFKRVYDIANEVVKENEKNNEQKRKIREDLIKEISLLRIANK